MHAGAEAGVIEQHLLAAMRGAPMPSARYTGYASCPLITAKNKCILAEFGYDVRVRAFAPLPSPVHIVTILCSNALTTDMSSDCECSIQYVRLNSTRICTSIFSLALLLPVAAGYPNIDILILIKQLSFNTSTTLFACRVRY